MDILSHHIVLVAAVAFGLNAPTDGTRAKFMQLGSVQNCQAGEAISDFPKGAVKQTAGAKGEEFLLCMGALAEKLEISTFDDICMHLSRC